MKNISVSQTLLKDVARQKWERITLKKRAGALVPLFSVYSKKSIGIGDFDDLKLLVDWASKTGMSILQLLPMNEVGGLDCPYDAESSFALEPAYASLGQAAGDKFKAIKERVEAARRLFPMPKEYVDYGIKKEKCAILRALFLMQEKYEGPDFQRFRQENNYWLQDFALYKVLKEYHKGLPWFEWPDTYRLRDRRELEKFLNTREKEIMFQMWVQWQLYKQFKEAKLYAGSKGVLIKGDLPILVSRDSADVWSHPEFFKLESAAGAPPDMYCAKGQRWGMPTNNWEKIKFDDYRYVKERLKYAENFYDILRIDHVVGLFRIWSIPYNDPLENQGLNGRFDPPDEKEWKEHGKSILSVCLDNTAMLLCAEDLGVIPKACTQTLEELGIPGNDVQRWIKDWKVKYDFLPPSEFRFFSVAILSTHDTTNWLAWWENEAGTIDEALFIKKCIDRVDYGSVKGSLFDAALSRHGRLRWLKSVDSVEKLVAILGRKKEELADFIDLYVNSFQEKEKLWKQLGMPGAMREKGNAQLLAAALKVALDAESIFSIQLITDWLGLTDLLQGDPYHYRMNLPGTMGPTNWSLVMPIPLDDLLRHPVCAEIKKLVVASKRE